MRKSFKYRLYPTRKQTDTMAEMLETHRHLYNDALAQRKDAYEGEKRTVSYVEQSRWMKDRRKEAPTEDGVNFLARTNFSSGQATLRRLDKAFIAFLRRITHGETPGYPRFKGGNRFDSVDFPSYGDGCKMKEEGKRVYFQHIGEIKVKLHRPWQGQIKTASFKREAGKWYLILSCDLGDCAPPKRTGPDVGIDLGLKSFLVTSEGKEVSPPKYYRQAEAALRRAQRKVARRTKGSNRRRKAVLNLQRQHAHIANQRQDFHHKTARKLVDRYAVIYAEELNIKGIARTRLAKSTHDVGWGRFFFILESKAEEAGSEVVKVNPRNTTQMCSNCHGLPSEKVTLNQRMYECEHCGFVLDRDWNAALNILRLGRSLQADPTAAERRRLIRTPALARVA